MWCQAVYVELHRKSIPPSSVSLSNHPVCLHCKLSNRKRILLCFSTVFLLCLVWVEVHVSICGVETDSVSPVWGGLAAVVPTKSGSWNCQAVTPISEMLLLWNLDVQSADSSWTCVKLKCFNHSAFLSFTEKKHNFKTKYWNETLDFLKKTACLLINEQQIFIL